MTAKPRQLKAVGGESTSSEPSRKAQIVSIAADLFGRKGYDGTSLRDIAESAGLTKAALYYHFPDKEKLYQSVVITRMTALNTEVKSAVAAEADPMARIRAFFVASARRIDRDRTGWLASSNAFWSIQSPQVRKAIVPLRDEFENLLRVLITEAIEAERLRAVDPAVVGRLLLSGLNFIPRWHRTGGQLSAVQVVEEYLDLLLQGVAAPGSPERPRAASGKSARTKKT